MENNEKNFCTRPPLAPVQMCFSLWCKTKSTFVLGQELARYKCEHLYRGKRSPDTNAHIFTGPPFVPVQMWGAIYTPSPSSPCQLLPLLLLSAPTYVASITSPAVAPALDPPPACPVPVITGRASAAFHVCCLPQPRPPSSQRPSWSSSPPFSSSCRPPLDQRAPRCLRCRRPPRVRRRRRRALPAAPWICTITDPCHRLRTVRRRRCLRRAPPSPARVPHPCRRYGRPPRHLHLGAGVSPMVADFSPLIINLYLLI
jgi:hypothetical protein